MASYEGKISMVDVQQRLLCFEYLPKGSLRDYITDVLMKQGRVITSKVMGLVGYVLLEVLFNGIITFKSDIYNLSLYINNYGDIDYDEEMLILFINPHLTVAIEQAAYVRLNRQSMMFGPVGLMGSLM
uniref:Protein kinase domain-containing protein n=1 Tax=Aegilops tauschii TaxID=37682 RepID=M8AHY7_AEGTA